MLSRRVHVLCLLACSLHFPFATAQEGGVNGAAAPAVDSGSAETAEEPGHEQDGHDADRHSDHSPNGHDDHDDGSPQEEVIVQATRSGRALSDEPIRVEVLNQEEIEEKALMRPGNISMLVAETGGVRVQTTSPALGAANIRLQGLFGRYTQLLSDGLPLYGGQAPSLGLLQVPPTDLYQVEIIKGSASSFYGGSALGGVINLISRRPGSAPEAETLLNLTSRDGQDFTGYLAAPLDDAFGASLTVGAHRQSAQDIDQDGWIDLASYGRWTARPRLFWDGVDGAHVSATLGYMTEEREGGTLPGQTVPDGKPFLQNQDTTRIDGGFIGEAPLGERFSWNARGSAMVQDHEHQFGVDNEDDQHESYLLETSLSATADKTHWVLGIAYQKEAFDSRTFPDFNFRYRVPAFFAQVDRDVTEILSLSLSGRYDDHSEYGSQLSPRLAALYRPGSWTVRASFGGGYFAPTPFVEEIEASGLSRLEPLVGIQEETARTASLDIGHRGDTIEANVILFGSEVDGATELQPFASTSGGPLDRVRLVNAQGKSRIRGSELLLRYFWNDFKFTGSYLYLDATERDPEGDGRRRIGLTPRHSVGFVAMWEQHGRGRLGFEAYYTGRQRLDNNPYREESEAYWHLGLLGEITIGRFSLFVNAENLLNVRQTRKDPLVLPTRSPEGQWTTDVWSRLDGFVLNGGVRIRLGR